MSSKKMSAGLKSALASLEKKYGEPVVLNMSDTNNKTKTITSGRPDLDAILGGGYSCGHVIEIVGWEASGKTGLALECVREVQKAGGTVGYIDSEHALDNDYCEKVGVNLDELMFAQPDYGEQAFSIARVLIGSGELDLLVFDSVAAMIPQAELEGETGESKMGLHARMMSQGLKQIIGVANSTSTTVIFINQFRESMAMYGAKNKPTGGNSLKFYAKQRLEVKGKEKLKVGEDVIGFKQQIKTIKNKIYPPFKVIEYDIIYDKGVDTLTSLIDALVYEGIFEKAGAYYKYEGNSIAQGMKKLRALLEDNEEFVEVLENKLKELRK